MHSGEDIKITGTSLTSIEDFMLHILSKISPLPVNISFSHCLH